MLPSVSAGKFDCGRPQIVFERAIVIEPKLYVVTVSSPARGFLMVGFGRVLIFHAAFFPKHRRLI